MSDSFRQALRRKVVSRATAQQLGTVSNLLVTVDCRQIAAVMVGKGKKALLVEWSQVSGFGADARPAAPPPRRRRSPAAACSSCRLGGLGFLSHPIATVVGDENRTCSRP